MDSCLLEQGLKESRRKQDSACVLSSTKSLLPDLLTLKLGLLFSVTDDLFTIKSPDQRAWKFTPGFRTALSLSLVSWD